MELLVKLATGWHQENRTGQAVGVTGASHGRHRMPRRTPVSWRSVGPTDALVPDLEDAVAIGGKVAARLLVIGAVRADLYAGRKVAIHAPYTPGATQMAHARGILAARDHPLPTDKTLPCSGAQ